MRGLIIRQVLQRVGRAAFQHRNDPHTSIRGPTAGGGGQWTSLCPGEKKDETLNAPLHPLCHASCDVGDRGLIHRRCRTLHRKCHSAVGVPDFLRTGTTLTTCHISLIHGCHRRMPANITERAICRNASSDASGVTRTPSGSHTHTRDLTTNLYYSIINQKSASQKHWGSSQTQQTIYEVIKPIHTCTVYACACAYRLG